MALILLILTLILSFTPFAGAINTFLRKNMKIWEKILIIIAFISLFLLIPWISSVAKIWDIALEILIFLLFLPILGKVFSASIAMTLIPYRKWLGILMGMLALVHAFKYLWDPLLTGNTFTILPWEWDFWVDGTTISYLWIGLIALIFTFVLLITSNIYSMKLLGKTWKKIQRWSYIILMLVYFHVMLMRGTIDLFSISMMMFFIIGKILEWKRIVLVQKPVSKIPA